MRNSHVTSNNSCWLLNQFTCRHFSEERTSKDRLTAAVSRGRCCSSNCFCRLCTGGTWSGSAGDVVGTDDEEPADGGVGVGKGGAEGGDEEGGAATGGKGATVSDPTIIFLLAFCSCSSTSGNITSILPGEIDKDEPAEGGVEVGKDGAEDGGAATGGNETIVSGPTIIFLLGCCSFSSISGNITIILPVEWAPSSRMAF